MVPSNAFLQAVGRAPTVTLEQLEAESGRAKRKWVSQVASLNDGLEAYRKEVEILSAEKVQVEASLEATRKEFEVQQLQKEKSARNLAKIIFERSQLDGEVIREETTVAELKKKLNALSLEKDRMQSAVHSEGVELLKRRAVEDRLVKQKLEDELKHLMGEVFDLKDAIEQGVAIKQAKLRELKHLVYLVFL
jgi:hypothetical protein